MNERGNNLQRPDFRGEPTVGIISHNFRIGGLTDEKVDSFGNPIGKFKDQFIKSLKDLTEDDRNLLKKLSQSSRDRKLKVVWVIVGGGILVYVAKKGVPIGIKELKAHRIEKISRFLEDPNQDSTIKPD